MSDEKQQQQQQDNFLDQGFPYKVRFGTAGLLGERRLRSKNIEVKAKNGGQDPKPGAVKPDAKLLDPKEDNCPELQAVWDKQQEVQRYIAARSVRSSVVPGVYVVRTAYFMEVRNKIKEGQQALKDLVEKFLAVYPEAKKRASERLGASYNEDQYPDEQKIRNGIFIKARIIDIGLDEEKIRTKLGEAVLEEQLEELRADLKEAKEEIRAGLIEEFRALLNRAYEIVLGTEDGKPKVFKSAAVTNLQEFCRLFDAKDVTDFAELRELVRKTQEVMEGKGPDDIRGSKAIREELSKAFKPIVASLNGMALLKGDRKVVLD